MPPTYDEDELRASVLAFYKAIEACDVVAMASVWSDEAPLSCVFPGQDPIVGREAVLDSWVDIFRGTRRISFTLRNVNVFVAGGVGWAVLTEEVDAQHNDGNRVRAASVATNLFVREADGWRLVHHHSDHAISLPEAAQLSSAKLMH